MNKTTKFLNLLKELSVKALHFFWISTKFIVRFLLELARLAAKALRVFIRRKKKTPPPLPLPPFHPATQIRRWGDNGEGFTIAQAVTGILCLGQTGSGKSSALAKHIMYGYLAAGFGGLVCCVKKEEREQIVKWATECGRANDLIIVDTSAKWRFNFLAWEAQQGAPGGVVLNTVAILEELAKAIAKTSGQSTQGGGSNKFWEDSLHLLLIQLVSIPVFAGLEVKLSLLRDLLDAAPLNLAQPYQPEWQENNVLYQALKEADELTRKAPYQTRFDFEQCRNFWLLEFPKLHEKTRSIISMTFSSLVQPLIMGVLSEIFCSETNVKPEDTFEGKIIIVDLPIQELRLVGRIANLIFKYCTQVSILRREQPKTPNTYLRPVVIYADECQHVLSDFDQMFQTTARSAGGASFYLTQNRENFVVVLRDNNAVDSLLANLTNKFFCRNVGNTNSFAAHLIGQRYVDIMSTNVSHGGSHEKHSNSGASQSEQYRFYVEPQRFTTLKNGGFQNDLLVEVIAFKGGDLFLNPEPDGEEFLPYKLLVLKQV